MGRHEIRFTHWKDRTSHKFYCGRNVHLQNQRSWTLWLGKHCFGIEVHGFGPRY